MPKKRDEQGPYWVQLREAERSIIVFALTHGTTIRGTATLLGTSPNFLAGRMRELGIPAPEVKPGPKPGAKPTRPLRVVSGNGAAPADEPEPEADTADTDPDDWADDADDDADGDGDDDADGDDDEGDDEGDDDAEDTPENAPEDASEDDDGPGDEAHGN
jgi:hypothetical protein